MEMTSVFGGRPVCCVREVADRSEFAKHRELLVDKFVIFFFCRLDEFYKQRIRVLCRFRQEFPLIFQRLRGCGDRICEDWRSVSV